jgi:hypothetical protein
LKVVVDNSTVDQKAYWGLGEVAMWIRTRDYERLAAISELNETEAMARAMFTDSTAVDPRSLWRFSTMKPDADPEVAATPGSNQSARIERAVLIPADRVLDDLQRKLRSGRLQVTAIKCGERGEERIPVPLADLNDLTFRFTPGDPIASVGLWARSRGALAWRSPQFLRVDVVRVWPARNTRTAAVAGAIRRRLQEIMLPEHPLTKLEAQQRCMAEVANAYPAAFKKAWIELDQSCKRGRGKHGPRIH